MIETENIHASRDLALLLLMLDGGLRREEVISLDHKNVDLFTGRIAVLAAKGDNQRWAYIESPTIAAIVDWLAHHPGGGSGPLFVALFGKNRGQRLNPRTVNRALREWSGRAGLREHLRPHDLRRLFATYFDQSGGGTRILQNILGHESLTTTERYIIHQDDEIRRQHRRHSPVNRLNF
jgi:site-specific recombinase XerC